MYGHTSRQAGRRDHQPQAGYVKKGVPASGTDARTPRAEPEFYLDCVSVVVVVVGPGIEVDDEVVVELWVESDAQPETNARAATAMHERMICFIIVLLVWIVTYEP